MGAEGAGRGTFGKDADDHPKGCVCVVCFSVMKVLKRDHPDLQVSSTVRYTPISAIRKLANKKASTRKDLRKPESQMRCVLRKYWGGAGEGRGQQLAAVAR